MQIGVFYILSKQAQTILLATINVRKFIFHFKPAGIAELGSEGHALVHTTHIKMVQTQPIDYAAQIGILINPPVVEVTVYNINKWYGKKVPTLLYLHHDIYFVVGKLQYGYFYRIKKFGVVNLIPVGLQHQLKGFVGVHFPFRHRELPQNNFILGFLVAGNENIINQHHPGISR